MNYYIGKQVVFTQPVVYVDYDLSFCRYAIKTPVGNAEINVSKIFLSLYPEHLAVAMTAWGDMREKFRLYSTAPERNKMRDVFIKEVTFEKRF